MSRGLFVQPVFPAPYSLQLYVNAAALRSAFLSPKSRAAAVRAHLIPPLAADKRQAALLGAGLQARIGAQTILSES